MAEHMCHYFFPNVLLYSTFYVHVYDGLTRTNFRQRERTTIVVAMARLGLMKGRAT